MRVLVYRLVTVCMMRKMTVQETLGRNAEQEDEQQEKSLAGSYFLCGDQKCYFVAIYKFAAMLQILRQKM